MRAMLWLALIALSGCATVINGTTQTVRFDTAPGGGNLKLYDSALYRIKPIYDGPLPVSLELARDKIYKYDVQRDGYRAKTAILKPSMSGWEAVSDAIPVLALIDTGTGAGRKFDNEVIISLQANSPTPPSP
jgi:uncharacterized protein YceK